MSIFDALARMRAALRARWRQPTVLVKQLGPHDRRRMLRHFQKLEAQDRVLRFGLRMSDEQIARYVEQIDFKRDVVYGVYSRKFKLLAVGHLAFASASSHAPGATEKESVAEFGVSVLRSARGLGIGSKLFQRAAIHCRNSDVDTLYMQCLSTNKVMMHIARKAGMEIVREQGEADAHLRLLPPDPASILQEALEEQLATFDYALKANARAAFKFFGRRRP
jgi:GNAT superfamily N-acetyltransferase